MKNKKRLGFLSAIMGVCLTATTLIGNVAFADENLYGAKNDVGIAFFANNVDYFTDGSKTVNLTSKDYPNLTLKVQKGGATLVEGVNYFYNEGVIIYGEAGEYTVTLMDNKGTNDTSDDTIASNSATITVKGSADITKANYDITKVDDSTSKTYYDKFVEEVKSKISGVGKDTSFDVPSSFWDLVNIDKAFESSHIATKLYVAKPKSDFSPVNSSWKTTMSKISVSANGTYAFYVELKDAFGNELVVNEDEMTQKIVDGVAGWYDNATNNLVIPIFTFEYSKVVLPSVEFTSIVSAGIIGVEYTSGKVTSENISSSKVTLYYNADATIESVTIDELDNLKNGWVVATSDHATFSDISATSLKFTPNVKGSFAYKITATGSDINNTRLNACSKPINVSKSVQEQKLVNVKFRNFLKNNWLSLVFLGVAFLCIVGIVVLAFYKPKDAEEIKAKKRAKKERIEDPEDEKVVEEVEDAEEAPAEEVDDAEEAPAEEVEEVEETPAEEVEGTPVEDATEEVVSAEEVVEASVEEVKPDGENA